MKMMMMTLTSKLQKEGTKKRRSKADEETI